MLRMLGCSILMIHFSHSRLDVKTSKVQRKPLPSSFHGEAQNEEHFGVGVKKNRSKLFKENKKWVTHPVIIDSSMGLPLSCGGLRIAILANPAGSGFSHAVFKYRRVTQWTQTSSNVSKCEWNLIESTTRTWSIALVSSRKACRSEGSENDY